MCVRVGVCAYDSAFYLTLMRKVYTPLPFFKWWFVCVYYVSFCLFVHCGYCMYQMDKIAAH